MSSVCGTNGEEDDCTQDICEKAKKKKTIGKTKTYVGGILKWILERHNGMVHIGLMWLRIGTSGGLL
jgi:hypothetical protein